MKRFVVDSNVLIRFCTFDPPHMGEAAKRFLLECRSKNFELYLDSAVIAEVVYVLTSFYKYEKNKILITLFDLFSQGIFVIESLSVIQDALLRFNKSSVSFIDALVAARAYGHKCEVASFDKDFDSFPDIKRYKL